jgi:hypothetical protein
MFALRTSRAGAFADWPMERSRCNCSAVTTSLDRLDLPAMPHCSRKQIYQIMFL